MKHADWTHHTFLPMALALRTTHPLERAKTDTTIKQHKQFSRTLPGNETRMCYKTKRGATCTVSKAPPFHFLAEDEGLSASAVLTFWVIDIGDHSLLGRPGTARWLVASVASTRQLPVALPDQNQMSAALARFP